MQAQLAAIAREVGSTLAAAGSDITLPELSELNRTAWVQRLAVLSAQQIEVEGSFVETEIRRFLAHGLEAACARAEPCRQAMQARADAYLDLYWEQLRTYSKEHCDSDFDVDAVLPELTARFIDADLERCQEEIAAAPFLIGR